MRALVQRVLHAQVQVDGRVVGDIETGLLVYVGVEAEDAEPDLAYLAKKLPALRIFPDSEGKMNLDVRQVGGGILLVSNFTLMGDARKGRRPDFTQAAPPEQAEKLFQDFADRLRAQDIRVSTGTFGAAMTIPASADGPVNVLLDSRRRL